MVNMRRQHNAAFKAKVALEAVKGEKTITQISSEFSVHPNQIRQWRRRLLEMLPDLFSDRRNAGQVVTSCSRFHPGWRILQNKKSKQGGMIISGSLKNGKPVYRNDGKCPYRSNGN